MAVEVFTTPDSEIKIPTLSFELGNIKQQIADQHKAEEQYIKDLVKYLNGKGYNQPDTGFVLKFPVADGHALYMVISTDKPKVFHLKLGDAWEFGIHKFTDAAFRKEIQSQKGMEAYWETAKNKAQQEWFNRLKKIRFKTW
jgi:hypothetical protein